jgi:hypothetical protein
MISERYVGTAAEVEALRRTASITYVTGIMPLGPQ